MDIDLLKSRFFAIFTPAELAAQEGEWDWRVPSGFGDEPVTRIGYATGEMNLYFLMYARHKGLNTLVYSHTATEIDGVEALVHRLVDGVEGIQLIRLSEENL